MPEASARHRRRTVAHLPGLPEVLAAAGDDFDAVPAWEQLWAGPGMTLPDPVHDRTLVECVWRGVQANGRTFGNLRCRDVLFEGCDFSGADLDGAELTRVRFVDCRLTGIVLSGTRLTDVVVDGGLADLANFRTATCAFLRVTGASLREADFYRTKLTRSALLDTDLTAAGFEAAKVDGLDLHGCTVADVRGTSAFAGGGVGIDPEQLVTLGAAVLAEMNVRAAPRPDDIDRPPAVAPR